MEILGFDETPERDFRDPAFDKSQHAGFLDLLADNKFLGTGDNYLCSGPIKKVRISQYLGPGIATESHVTRHSAWFFMAQALSEL